ncbi:hypothetical protein DRQ05_03160, partial [bacterium]
MKEKLFPRVGWLDGEKRKRIIDEAKDILEKVGVFVENDEALELLDGAGAKVERNSNRVYIPAYLVENALETAPPRVRIYDLDGDVAMDLGGDR